MLDVITFEDGVEIAANVVTAIVVSLREMMGDMKNAMAFSDLVKLVRTDAPMSSLSDSSKRVLIGKSMIIDYDIRPEVRTIVKYCVKGERLGMRVEMPD